MAIMTIMIDKQINTYYNNDNHDNNKRNAYITHYNNENNDTNYRNTNNSQNNNDNNGNNDRNA